MQAYHSPTVVITGASAGVGRATAIAFGQQGYKVGLIARSREGLEGARADVEAVGSQALVLPADVADAQAVEQAAARAEQELGPIDVWINSAMLTVLSPVAEMTPEEYRRVTEVTYLGYVHGTLAALRYMRPRNRGTIVQVGSALAYRAIPLQSAYCGAKFAIRGFTDSLRSELIHEGSHIRLTMVQLPAINTPQFDWARNRMPKRPQPVPPIFQPEAAAQAILQAAQTAPRELWVGRPALMVILGNMLAPSLIDRKLAQQGYSDQQANEPADPNQEDNLYTPVPGKHRVHGRFDELAQPDTLQISSETVGKLLLASTVGLALFTFLLGYTKGKKSDGKRIVDRRNMER